MKLLDYLKEHNIKFTVSGLNLSVGGSLYLRDTAISELPDNLSVGGNLYLRNTAISELPDNLSVGGNLVLEGTAISELPDNLSVGGGLDLRNTAISELPDNLSVGGNLYLRNTAISELPDNLSVVRSLYLEEKLIRNISFKTDCGANKRTIFAVRLYGDIKIAAGCFLGSQELFNERVDSEYDTDAAEQYKLDAAECVKGLIELNNQKAA